MKHNRKIPTLGDSEIWPQIAARIARHTKPRLGSTVRPPPPDPADLSKDIREAKAGARRKKEESDRANKQARKMGHWI